MVCTLKDIAAELDISINTVSRALKDKKDISAAMKVRIKKTAAEMGYIPNLSARNLRTGTTKTVAIVYDNFCNPYYSIMMNFLQNAFAKNKYGIIIFTNVTFNEKIARKILSQGVDGIISFLEVEDGAAAIIQKAGKYLLVLGRDSSGQGIDCITTDDVDGGYKATKYLIDNGHRDILVFSAQEDISCARLRVQGYKKALAEAGIEFKDNNVKYVGRDGWNGAEFAEKALAAGEKFTAVFCFNDIIAYEAVSAFQKLGLRVPDDVSIVGYDNVESDFLIPVGLASIDTDKRQTADVAVELALHKMQNINAHSFVKIHAPQLVEGRTVKKLTN